MSDLHSLTPSADTPLLLPLNLRIDGENDDEFRTRAERSGRIARVLVTASLANRCVQEYLADESLPYWTEQAVRNSPTVRMSLSRPSRSAISAAR